MTVSITWSSTNGGSAISSVDHGNSSNGATTTAQELFVRHDGSNEITNVGFYIGEYAGTYSGTFTAAEDLAELISWGDGSGATAFGGIQFNFLATTGYGSSGWPTYSSKTPTGGDTCRTGVGDSEANAISIPTTTGASVAGEIQSGSSPNVRFQMRAEVPQDEDTVGIRQWSVILRYNYTS